MTDPISSMSRWLRFFCCCIWHARNCFSFFFLTECLLLCYVQKGYGKKCRMTQLFRVQVTSKQNRHFIILFWTVILFTRLNVNMFFLFVCLSDCKYLLFPCVSDTLAVQLIYRGKVELCHPLHNFCGKEPKIIFRGHIRPQKLNSTKNNPHVFETKPRKFGDAKIPHYTVLKYPIIRY